MGKCADLVLYRTNEDLAPDFVSDVFALQRLMNAQLLVLVELSWTDEAAALGFP